MTEIQVNHRSFHGTPGHTTATPHIYTHNTKKSYSLTRQDYQLTINSLKVASQLQSIDMGVTLLQSYWWCRSTCGTEFNSFPILHNVDTEAKLTT